MQLKRNKEMEFETLKKSYKKQIIMGALAICVIGGALTYATSRAFYKVTESIPLVKGTVNYNVPDLRVVAIKTSEDGTKYSDVNDVPTSGYALNTTKSICKIATTDAKDENITMEYSDGKVNFLGVSKKNTRCYLYFDKKITSEDTLAKLNITPKEGTPNFANVATTDEGVYKVSDPVYGGTSYYWRGAVTTNYVRFAGFCWRIVRINGDGSMRLIYDGTTCHANGTSTTESLVQPISGTTGYAYNTSYNQSNYVGWTYSGTSQRPSSILTGTASNAKMQLESWYSSNIKVTNAQKVAEGKYCNDRNAQSDNTWDISPSSTFYYAGYKRIYTDHNPSLACDTDDVYTLSVGLITVDEVMYAGGTNVNNTSYYLHNGQNYWIMSPYIWNGNDARVFLVNTKGCLSHAGVSNTAIGLRPVINLKADTSFKAGGTGTQNNPYVVID